MKKYELHYTAEAPYGNEGRGFFSFLEASREDDGWEKWSLPIGNSYMGVNVFGRCEIERLQITENSLYNPPVWDNPDSYNAGLSSLAEVYLEIGHRADEVKNYRRSLSLNEAIARTAYEYRGVRYTRECFASYPDRVAVLRLAADRPASVSFTLRAEVPFPADHLLCEGDGMGKEGEVCAHDACITLTGKMHYFGILFEGQFTVRTVGGRVNTEADRIRVEGADSAEILLAVGSNYEFESRVFTEPDPKKKLAPYPHPHAKVQARTDGARRYTYEELLARHAADWHALFDRAEIDLGGVPSEEPTDRLLVRYRDGARDPYLEELLFAYGRYLLISSSRPGAYPANLQGTWNQYASSPWTSGYWHNINVQMNYWPAFNTNLCELFLPYIDYFRAYRAQTEAFAEEYVRRFFPERYEEGKCGMTIGTGASLFKVDGIDPPGCGHSGPGTGAFTAKLFTDYCDFSMDRECLERDAYLINRRMAEFLSKLLEEQEDGTLLVKYSASPEQRHNGLHYHSKGTAFDQEMVYECYKDTVRIADELGISDAFIEQLRRDISRLDPVQIGASGQIKEFREETYYGEIGEPHHRHISHLVGLYPGTLIGLDTPEWLAAAQVTLEMRGEACDKGWSCAHKMNMLARAKNGRGAYHLLHEFLRQCTFPNLWGGYTLETGARLFQIDGSLGTTAGMAEMLLQSHEGFLHVLPALPDEWRDGSFTGLTARGGFTVSARWRETRLCEVRVRARTDAHLRLFLGKGYTADGIRDGMLERDLRAGEALVLNLS